VSGTQNLPVPSRALAIGAHADDVEFGCGATLAKWAAAGSEVHLCVLTDGSKGSWDPATDVAELVATRRREQEAAADVLGIKTVHFLGLVDGELEDGLDQRAALSAVIREVQPDVVIGHDPWKRYRLHPDHRAAGTLTIDAIVAARDPHFFPGRGEPHRPETLLLFEAEETDHFEDVTSVLDAKIKALLAHKTQWHSTMGIDPNAPDAETQRTAFEARIKEDARAAGKETGIDFAEAFKRIQPL
jgi:LmbE family N-acetylglucosaminyl deacetylase